MWNDPVVKDTFFPLLTSYGSGGPMGELRSVDIHPKSLS